MANCFTDDAQPTELERKKELRCRLVRHTHAYFILGPLKLEEHSLQPYIVALHDFMSPTETELFKSLVIERLRRSEHVGRHSTSDKRTSKQLTLIQFNLLFSIFLSH